MQRVIPKKAQLANMISETLSMEKETVYRRLRGATMFTLGEVAALSRKFNFSLDEILIGIEQNASVTNMMLKPFYTEKKKGTEKNANTTIAFVEDFVKDRDTQFGMALGSIPFPVIMPYKHISDYYKYKYKLHEKELSRPVYFRDVKQQLPEWKRENMMDTYNLFREISHTIYIWDKKIIPVIVNDILYFKSLGLMDKEDIEELKSELFSLMDGMEETASIGIFNSTGNKCDIYISDEDIDSTYAYLWSENRCTSLLITHYMYLLVSYNNKSKCKEIKDWVNSMKFNSTLISGTGGKERILFFKQQREVIGTL
ncbi:MAG: hypothetical protein LBU37_06295 [Tannerellaceae bacterium]|jgi:hypothetical protein|nr:hypothetical protein [Tannerellaceae bacterium]